MTLRLHAGYTTLEGRDDGSLEDAGRDGLYDLDCRILRRFRYFVDGQAPVLVAAAVVAPHRWRGRLTVRRPDDDASAAGPRLRQDAVELAIDRAVGGGLVDRLAITNHSAAAAVVELGVEADADFADAMEATAERRHAGETRRAAIEGGLEWHHEASHEGRTDRRAARLRIEGAAAAPERDAGRLRIRLELGPHGTAELRLVVESLIGDAWRRPDPDRQDAWLERWEAVRAHVDSPGSALCDAVERAAADLGGLRNDELFGASDERAWFPNAGVPMFTGFFGRDTLTAAWQAALLGPEMLRGAIEGAARTQSTGDDPWRDAEPGKLVHEIRRGPLSVLEIVPQSGYYGSQTTGSMFLLALSEYWHWTADRAFVRRHLPVARRVLEWAERHGDLDGDGFLEYRRRSRRGLRNQGWKDSDEAIRHTDGRVVEPPVATVEEQAFLALALERMAELLVATDDASAAEPFIERARELRRRWHEAYWLPEDGFYALALDGQGQAAASITSNPLHALAAGIVPGEHARRVAERLFEPDLFSGWGVRTLSSDHPSFNPYAYHLGSVWPVEQATFALGCKRYGFDDLVDRIVEGMLGAAAGSPGGRLPELLAGVPRADFERPILYPEANAPQAWSASATVQLLQVSLGLYPFAPMGALLLVRPRLPEAIPEVTVSNLRVGRAVVSLAFRREPDGTARHEVVERRGRLALLEAGPPQGDPAGWGERLAQVGLRAGRGRRFRAARIALGLETVP